MLAAAMDGLLSPLFLPSRVRFVPVRPPVSVGLYSTPANMLFPVEERDLPADGLQIGAGPLASGAMYVLCYRPLHPDVPELRRLARTFVELVAPELPQQLLAEAREALTDHDWVGTVGRLWTACQIDPDRPELLDELAVSCMQFGFVSAARRNRLLAARLARASGEALNELRNRFPAYAPGHLHRAEFLAAAGVESGAFVALREAMRLGLTPEQVEDARVLVRELSGLTGRGVANWLTRATEMRML